MENMVRVKDVVEKRDVYVPPCVVKISDLKQGAGECGSGSGDANDCCTGNSAADTCIPGNSACPHD
jgi:hypothetical protein